ncbi:MAG: 4-(cytidine 5'-diphospho)-2-C-methyl-D-erythritol kinase [Tepidanaerobacteraceae bacterium]|nr:4-(cytidine 5'-diphospho)-2-C-methyl-D-erythritol kinase [Tepidanaerobacteraceae bacterium]
MTKIDIEARGKINLTLDVLFKRPDDYHEVEMIMQNIALKDIISLELVSKRNIRIKTDCSELPCDKSNLAYQAAELMMNEFQLDAGICITLNKNIPLAAGLAGGSADAAAVIVGINELFDLKRPQEELMTLGKRIGADVPFCIFGKTALARGIGERITPLTPLSGFGVLLIKPPCFVSTKQVYSRLNIKNIKNRPDTKSMVEHIRRQNIGDIASKLCNVLEEVTFKLYPELVNIKNSLIQKGALGSLMSGSGPTVFGLFESALDARKAAGAITENGYRIFITEMK